MPNLSGVKTVKRKVLLICLILCLMLPGCQILGFDTEDTLRPPRATGDQADIQKVLEQEEGGDITLRYPQRGDYRSAIVMEDINADGQEEAIAFYRSNKTNDVTMNMMVIGKPGGIWQNLGKFVCPNGMESVDKVLFSDLDGDGTKEILVGWTGSVNASVNQLTGYQYQDGTMKELSISYTYSEVLAEDFDRDGCSEIFLASLKTASQDPVTNERVEIDANARIIKIDKKSEQLINISVVQLDPNVTRYASVIADEIAPGQMGVVIDGYQEKAMLTEVVYWDEGTKSLRSPLSFSEGGNPTVRPTTSWVSRDFDGDGIVEIPTMELMPGYTADSKDPTYITSWWRFNPKTERPDIFVYDMVTNSAGRYCFRLPEAWRDHVTANLDTATQTLTFYEWNGAQGVALLNIQVFSAKEWESGEETNGFVKMYEHSDGRVIAANTPNPDNPYTLTYQEIKENLMLISNL